MTDDRTLIGRGRMIVTIAREPNLTEKVTLDLCYEIKSTGILFRAANSGGSGRSLFEWVDQNSGNGGVQVTGRGHLILPALPASPNAAFQSLTLDYNTSEFTIRLTQADSFAPLANAAFQALDLAFTQRRAESDLIFQGEVTAVIFGQPVPLMAEIDPAQGFVFRTTTPPSSPIESNGLGRLTLEAVEVGPGSDQRSGLQALYTFDEGGGSVVHDISGATRPLDLDIENAGRAAWLPGGLGLPADLNNFAGNPLVRSRQNAASRLVDACTSSDQVTVEAWVRPTALFQVGPARIVSLSADADHRNLALGHGPSHTLHEGEPPPDSLRPGDFYTARVRTTDPTGGNVNNGWPKLFGIPGVLTTEQTYVVFTRDDHEKARLFINGVKSEEATRQGKFDNWFRSYFLLLGNEFTRNRPWAGEFYRVAIYNTALTQAQIYQAYYPSLRVRGRFALTDVPAPLNEPLTAELAFFNDHLLLTIDHTQPLSVTPHLSFEHVQMTWQQSTDESWILLNGQVTASLWGNPLNLVVEQIESEGRRLLRLAKAGSSPANLTLNGLGRLALISFALQADPTLEPIGWALASTSQITFTAIPAPLTGPLAAALTIETGRLWLEIAQDGNYKLVDYFTFTRLMLGFSLGNQGWDSRGQVQALVLDNLLTLAVQPTDHGLFALNVAGLGGQPLITTPAELTVTALTLAIVQIDTPPIWQLTAPGTLRLSQSVIFNGELILGDYGNKQRLLFAPQNQPTVEIPFSADMMGPALIVRIHLTQINIVKEDDEWVFGGIGDLHFNLFDIVLSGAGFRVDASGAGFALDSYPSPVTIPLPEPNFNGQPVHLGAIDFDLADIVLALGANPAFCTHLTAHLPASLNQIFGHDNGQARYQVLAETATLQLHLTRADGLSLLILSSFLDSQWGQLVEHEGQTKLQIKRDWLETYLVLPELRFTDQGFIATGRFEETSVSLPLALIKSLARQYGAADAFGILPDRMNVVPLNVLDADRLDVDELLRRFEQAGIRTEISVAGTSLRSALGELADKLDRLPMTFRPYLDTTPPSEFNYQAALTADAGLAVELWADNEAPLRLLLGSAPPLPGLLGLTVSRLAVGEVLGGSLYTLKVSGELEYFNPFSLNTILALPEEVASRLPEPADLQLRFTTQDLFMTIHYQLTPLLPSLLFYRLLGFDYLGDHGLGLQARWQLPISRLNPTALVGVLVAMTDFLIDPSAELTNNPFPGDTLPAPFEVIRTDSQLPIYAGGLPPRRLPALDIHWTETQASIFIAAANALRKGLLGQLLELLPTEQRTSELENTGEANIVFGPMHFAVDWALLSEAEYPDVLQADIPLLSRWDDLSRDQRRDVKNLLRFDIDRGDMPENDAAIVFLVGTWELPQRVSFLVDLALAVTQAGHTGSGFSISGFITPEGLPDTFGFRAEGRFVVDPANRRQPVQIEGRSAIRLFNEEIFVGDIQLGDDSFVLSGLLNLFPRWSPLQVTGSAKFEINSAGEIALTSQVEVSLADFRLLDPVLTYANGHFTLSGLWLGAELVMTDLRRGDYFIFQGSVDFSLPFDLTIGPFYHPETGVKVFDRMKLCRDAGCWRPVTISVVVELSAAGFLGKVTAQFEWEDDAGDLHPVTIPEFGIFAAPRDRNGLLGHVVAELEKRGGELFSVSGM